MTTIALLAALSTSQASAPADTGRITGRVTVEGANAPIAGARIMLLPAGMRTGPMGMPPQAITDQNGRFVFDKVMPGQYRINVQKTGFAPLAEPSQVPATQVAAGQTVEILMQLQKGAVITGKVLDASGEPLTEAAVMAMRRMNMNRSGATTARLMPVAIQGPQQTNDLGEFRITGLAAGEYIVAATPRGGFGFGGPAVPPPSANGTAVTTTYYPGTIDQVAAHTVTVAAGQTVDNITFSMQSVPAFQVSGHVVDEGGAPIAGAMVMLMSDPRGGAAFMGPSGNARTGDDGRFTIAEVPSGTYRVHASVSMMFNPAGRGAGGGGGGGNVAIASGGIRFSTWNSVAGGVVGGTEQPTEVVVNGADVTGVRLVARRPTPQ